MCTSPDFLGLVLDGFIDAAILVLNMGDPLLLLEQLYTSAVGTFQVLGKKQVSTC